MNQDKRTLLPGLSLFVCFCLLTGMEKLITHFNLPPSLMALGDTSSSPKTVAPSRARRWDARCASS